MKICPFRTICPNDLKSQIFLTTRSSTCGKQHQKKQLPVRQDKFKNENIGFAFDLHKYLGNCIKNVNFESEISRRENRWVELLENKANLVPVGTKHEFFCIKFYPYFVPDRTIKISKADSKLTDTTV
jgi:hypothetical protein